MLAAAVDWLGRIDNPVQTMNDDAYSLLLVCVSAVTSVLCPARSQARDRERRLDYPCAHTHTGVGETQSRCRLSTVKPGNMAAFMDVKDEQRFWNQVWPTLKDGGWRYEGGGPEASAAAAAAAAAAAGAGGRSGGSDRSDEGRAVTSQTNRRTSSRNRKRTTSYSSNGSNGSSSSSSGSSDSNCGKSKDVTADVSRREPSAVATEGPVATAPSRGSVFFPPAIGEASEALEEAMRRSAPADGSLGDERLDRLVGVDAVIELLQQVPGFPGTTSGIVNFDAVAAAARGVLIRTPSPPRAAGLPIAEVSVCMSTYCWCF